MVLALLTWPSWGYPPPPGLDPSWMAGLDLSTRDSFLWGRDLVFTYGPLGFVDSPYLFDQRNGTLGFLYLTVVHVAVCATVFILLKQALKLSFALPLTYLAMIPLRAVAPVELVPALAAVWVYRLAQTSVKPRAARLIVAAGCMVTAVHLLVKLSTGLALIVVLLLAMRAVRISLRDAALALAITVVLVVALPLLLGQPPVHLGTYMTAALEIVSGHSTAMAIDGKHGAWDLLAAILAALLICGLIGANRFSRGGPVLAVFVIPFVLVAAYKQAFVREDSGHILVFFAAALLTSLAAIAKNSRQPTRGAVDRSAIPVFLAVAALTVAVCGDALPRPSIRSSIRSFAQGARIVGSTRYAASRIGASRSAARNRYALDGPLLSSLVGSGVHVDPWETEVMWAYPELTWKPLPVFQSYVAYTPALDRRNANSMRRTSTAPGRILRQTPVPIDGRHALFEAPRTTLELLCRYRQIAATNVWQVLDRGTDRCGPEVFLGETRTSFGTEIQVPPVPAGHIGIARVSGLEQTAPERLVALLYKGAKTFVSMDGAPDQRLVPSAANGPLAISVPHTLAWGDNFAAYHSTTTIRFRHSGLLARARRITVRFSAVPLAA